MADNHHHHHSHHEQQHRNRRDHAAVDDRDAYQDKKRNVTLLAALASINLQCARVKERQLTACQLHARLNQVFLRATTPSSHHGQHGNAMLEDPKRVAAFTSLLDAFQLTLKRHIKLRANIVNRALHHRMFSLQLRSIHYQLTAFLKGSGCMLDGFPVEWRGPFASALRQDESLLQGKVVAVVDKTTFLAREYSPLTTRQQMEVLLDIRHELAQTIDVSPALEDALKLIYKRLVQLFGWDLNDRSRRVPHWFVPMVAVDFSASRDILTKTKPTYRGEIAIEEQGGLKRHLVVMKCIDGHNQTETHIDENARAFEQFISKFGAINHPHVLRLRGGNFIAGAPFIVRDYATHGTLSGHVARLKYTVGQNEPIDESTVWKLLVDACEGLLFLHENFSFAHGGLKASNLLVNHRGRACVADVGLRQLRHQITGRGDDDEYVRWQAPELVMRTNQPEPKAPATTSADIFAFGMTIFEILSDSKPWNDLTAPQVEELKRSGSHLPQRPSTFADREWRLIEKMCAFHPGARLPLRQVFEVLVDLSRGREGDSIPKSADVDELTDDGEMLKLNEFETESVSSYKTTIEISDEQLVHVETKEEEEKADLKNEDDDEDETLIDSFNQASLGSYGGMAAALQTNNQLRATIDYLSDHHSSSVETLLPHLQLVSAFAKDGAQSIHECGGVRVLTALFTKHQDAQLRVIALEIYSAMLLSGHKAIVETLVEQGTVQLVFGFASHKDTSKTHVDASVSLLLELMGHSDEAKRIIGDSDRGYVATLEKNALLHRRLLQEVKSVLARFKQMEGNAMLKEGFHQLAIKRFSEAIELDRKRGIYYADRSLAYCHARQYHEAAVDAERCMRYTPFDAQGYMRFGIALRHMNKYGEALSALRRGYQVNPNHPQLAMIMGEVQELYNKHKVK